MRNKWDERYSSEKYIYGKEPNEFFREELLKLKPGKILLAAEGEGRNSVFAAKQGWEVTAFDSSSVAKNKAENLAKENNVKINYLNIDFDDINFEENYFDCIALTYVHTLKREDNHKKLIKYLKKGGIIILEAYSKEQIKFKSGGPQKIEMLFSEKELLNDFSSLNKIKINSLEKEITEGTHHFGRASIIRLIGEK